MKLLTIWSGRKKNKRNTSKHQVIHTHIECCAFTMPAAKRIPFTETNTARSDMLELIARLRNGKNIKLSMQIIRCAWTECSLHIIKQSVYTFNSLHDILLEVISRTLPLTRLPFSLSFRLFVLYMLSSLSRVFYFFLFFHHHHHHRHCVAFSLQPFHFTKLRIKKTQKDTHTQFR